ncbi:MAG: mechanosensitive ion channel family protein, partial [Phycisphaerae bacterium]
HTEQNPARMPDAVRGQEPRQRAPTAPEQRATLAATLARQLEQIIDELINTFGHSRDEIPDKPTAAAVSFPKQGEDQLVLVRSDDGLWRFSADTIGIVPELLASVLEKKKKKQAEEAPLAPVAASVPPEYASPRATMKTFLKAMADGKTDAAAECLDLSEKPETTRAETGATLATRLKYAIDHIANVVPQDIPDRPDGEAYEWYFSELGRIVLAPVLSGDRKGAWLFTAATVNQIEAIAKSVELKERVAAAPQTAFWTNPELWMLEKIPSEWKFELWSIQVWQWMGMLIIGVGGWLMRPVAGVILSRVARPLTRIDGIELLPTHIRSAMRPLAILVMVAIWWYGLKLLSLPTQFDTYLWPAFKFVMTTAAVWSAYRIIDLASAFFSARAARTKSRLDDVLVPLVRKTLKIIVVVVGLIFILQALGVTDATVNRLFAGLGLGGLAFALAAQDTIKNFFGSITVILDRPFQVGDWVKIGDVEGTVESVGLRSSRVRTFYNSEVTVPNSELISATVDNMGRRRFRRISCMLSVLYSTTPDQLDAFCEGVRELIRRHPYTRKDYYIVWVNEFAASSINILLYCFHETPDWTTELRERHRLFLDIMRLAKRLGVEFAFPTQTIHLSREDGAPATSAAAPSPRMPHGCPGVAAGSSDASETALAWGRDEAAQIVKQAPGESGAIPPPFEFPTV